MKPELQRYLDGELPLDALPEADRREAEEWNALFAAPGDRHVNAPAWIESRVMAELEAHTEPSSWRRALGWLTSPRSVRVRPITVALAGAAVAIAIFLARPAPRFDREGAAGAGRPLRTVTAEQTAIVYVQFVFANPAARTVTVAGDFNSWDVVATPLTDTDGDGIWTGRVALRPGLHKYMFVVDGEDWVTDPQADTYVDDGFGMRNAVLTVAGPNGRAI